jgi:hypothetical protein
MDRRPDHDDDHCEDDDAAFVWVKEWFLEQRFLKRIRRLDLDTTLRNERIALIPAPGLHWFWHGSRPFQVFAPRATWDREDFAGLGTGGAFWAVDLCDQSDRFHGSPVDECSQSSAGKFGSVV